MQEVTFNPKDSTYTVREVADVAETHAISLLALYALILLFLFWAAIQNKDRFSSLLIIGIAANFFL